MAARNEEQQMIAQEMLVRIQAARVIKHAPWATGAPPVCTAGWDQAAWDTFAEGYRPVGYTGGIHDDRAYMIWCASRCLEEGRAAQARIDARRANGEPGLRMEDRVIAARMWDALGAAGVCRESRSSKYRAAYCELGTCFVCTVARLQRGEK